MSDVILGPVVQIWTKEPTQGGVFENVEIRQLGNRYFIVGTLADRKDGTSDGRVGLPFWHPIDEVLRLIEFPSLNAARAAYSKYEERERDEKERDKPKRGWFS